MADASVHLDLANQHEMAMARMERLKAQIDLWTVEEGYHAIEQYVQACLAHLSGRHRRGFSAMMNELAWLDEPDVPYGWISLARAVYYNIHDLQARMSVEMLEGFRTAISEVREWAHRVLAS